MQNSLQPQHRQFQVPHTDWLTIGYAVMIWGGLGMTSMVLGNLSQPVAMALAVPQRHVPLVLSQVQSAPIAQTSDASRRTLRSGSRGDDVRELQAALKLLGYFTGAIDGVFGSQTEAAVRRFQAAAGTTPDGIVGVVTWSSLFPAATTFSSGSSSSTTSPTSDPDYPTLRRGDRGSAVERLQRRLQARGFLEGTADGVFGEATETAVKAAQRRYGLEADGIVGSSTWDALLR